MVGAEMAPAFGVFVATGFLTSLLPPYPPARRRAQRGGTTAGAVGAEPYLPRPVSVGSRQNSTYMS